MAVKEPDLGELFECLVLRGHRLPLKNLSKPQRDYAAAWGGGVSSEFLSDCSDAVKEIQKRPGPRHEFSVIHRHPVGDGKTSLISVAVPGKMGNPDRPVPVIASEEEDNSGPRIVYEMLYAQRVSQEANSE